MDLEQIMGLAQTGSIGLAIILLGLIKIPKLEINLWGLIARTLGRAINGEEIERIDKLVEEFQIHLINDEKDKIRQVRQHILRFNDEILLGRRHSKEHFDEILEDIDIYEKYCAAHPDYKNNKAALAINTIKETYDECTRTHDFLTYVKKEKEVSK